MKIVNEILEFISLNEKLVVVNKGKKNGQVIFLAGGGASGKGFAIDRFIDSSSYKVFDVDALKSRIIKLAKIKGDNPEIAGLDLTKSDDVATLHKYVKDNKLSDKMIDNFLKNVNKGKGLPNLMFDVTLQNIKKFNDTSEKLLSFGYEPKNIHIVWVLANYEVAIQNNLDPDRGRVVPADILFQTHLGAAQNMSDILKGNLPENLEGEVHVILSDKNETVLARENPDDPNSPILIGKSEITGKDTITIDWFTTWKVKEVGKKIKSDSTIQKDLFKWAKNNVPSRAKGLF